MSQASRLLGEMADLAELTTTIGSARSIDYYLDHGLPIPENMLPGRVIERLSPEKRELLKNLKSDDIADHLMAVQRYYDKTRTKWIRIKYEKRFS